MGMKKQLSQLIAGELLDDALLVELTELCRICHAPTQLIIEMVEYGMLVPKGNNIPEWQFTGSAITRIKTVMRLQQDLEVNLSGAAVIVEMIEELEQLRREVQMLKQLRGW